MTLKYATPNAIPNVDTFGNTIKSAPDLVKDGFSTPSDPKPSVSSQNQTTKGNLNMDGRGNRVTNDPISNPNGKKNTNRVGTGGNRVGNNPTAPRPVNNPSPTTPNSTPTNPSSQVSNPVTSVSKVSSFLNSPIAKTGGKVLGAVGFVLTGIDVATNIGSDLSNLTNEVTGQNSKNRDARRSFNDASKQYEESLLKKQKKDINDRSQRENLEKQEQKARDNEQRTNPYNSKGSFPNTGDGDYVPPFTGGQNPTLYRVIHQLYKTNMQGIESLFFSGTASRTIEVQGAILGGEVVLSGLTDSNGYETVSYRIRNTGGFVQSAEGASGGGLGIVAARIVILSVERVDNQNDTGDLPNPNPRSDTYTPPVDSPQDKGDVNDPNNQRSPDFTQRPPTPRANQKENPTLTTPPSPDFDNRQQRVPETPPFAPPSPTPQPTPSPNTDKKPDIIPNNKPTLTTPPVTPIASPTPQPSDNQRSPITTTPTRSDVPPSQAKNPLDFPLDPPAAPKVPTSPNTPPSPDLSSIATILGTFLLGLNALIQKLTKVDNQTTPEAQAQNAQTGACNAMQSPTCRKPLVDDIVNPVNAKQDANQAANAGLFAQILAAIANLASTIANLFGNVVGKLDGIKEFLEKVARSAKLDKIYNLLTFITVVHNAQMLSNSLATTLMDSLSLGLATIGIKDENESPIDIQSIINKSVEDTVKGIIGTANYTTISDRWKQAVRVYQAAANITYQVRSLWDSARSLAELTGANVGKIGNALRRDGAVSENAYTAMADNPLMVNSAMTKLQNLEEAASHLNSITSEAYSVTETVTQIKKDQDDFKKLVKESQPLTSVPNDAAKAKDDAAKLASVSPSISNIDLVKP